jgi:Fe-S-cluster containining protein
MEIPMAEKRLTVDVCTRECGGMCCRYVCVKASPPTTRADRDEHRWLLMHENIELRFERRKWYMLVHTRCKNLGKDNLCQIYPDRPDLCEDYDDDVCEGIGEPDEDTIVFRTVEEYDAFMAARGKPWRPRRRTSD